MRLSFVGEEMAPTVDSLDDLDRIEAYCLFIATEDRPLKGLAGVVDWRLCGALSGHLRAERFRGAPSEALLFSIPEEFRGRLPGEWIFCFGLENYADRTTQRLGRTLDDTIDRLAKAGVRRFAVSLPPAFGMTPMESARFFTREVAPTFVGEEITLVGNARGMAQIAREVASGLQGIYLDTDPWLSSAPTRNR